MNKYATLRFSLILVLLLSTASHLLAGDGHEDHANEKSEHVEETAYEDEHEHDDDKGHEEKQNDDSHDDEHGHAESKEISLTPEQQAMANIKVSAIYKKIRNFQVYAPADIKTNGYTSYIVSPRVDSIVIKRHKSLGEYVKTGDILITLFSETVAQAQAEYKVAISEWLRVQKLGKKAVGAKRYINAQTTFESAKARLLVYGLTEKTIKSRDKNFGEYDLLAHADGAILSDDFQQGQLIEAGHTLMMLSDEKQLWVEAYIQPTSNLALPEGLEAQVKVGSSYYQAFVTQEAHTINLATRTRVVRLLIDNVDHRLHAGMFADVSFIFKTQHPVMAVPEAALMRSADGDWAVFVQDDDGGFQSKEVELGRTLGEFREITGIENGTKIVTEGAFFVTSQIAKGDFDPHNH